MINPKLLNPQSIVIVGASNDVHKPGGKLVKNLLDSPFKGKICLLSGHFCPQTGTLLFSGRNEGK